MVVSLVSVSLSFSPSTYVTSYVCWISPSSPLYLATAASGCSWDRRWFACRKAPLSCVFPRRASRGGRAGSFCPLIFFDADAILLVQRDAFGVKNGGRRQFAIRRFNLPVCDDGDRPVWLMISPPVSLLYTLSILTVTFAASASFCSKNPISCSALVATVQKGTSCPLMVMVVW